MPRYFIEVSYRGTNYNGWQLQENAISVQQKLNEALSTILNREIVTTGSSRTDTGVHAQQNFAHFYIEIILPNDLTKRLNQFLPKDIAVNNIYPVAPDKHSRFDAIARSYEYHIIFKKDPFAEDLAYLNHSELDISILNKAAEVLPKYNDYEAFSKNRTQVKTTICNIESAEWKISEENKKLVFYVTGNRFLRGMVRGLVGTMLKVASGKYSVKEFEEIIKNKQKEKVDFSAPAKGLYLTKVKYPEVILGITT